MLKNRAADRESLWTLTEGQRGRYLAAIAALAMGTVCTFTAPLLARHAIDRMVGESTGDARLAIELGPAGAAVAMVLLTAVGACFLYVMGRLAATATEALTRRLRDHLFDHLQRLPASYHDTAETGDLVQRCTSDVETLRLFFSAQVIQIGRVALMLVTVLPIMLWLDVGLTLASLAGLPIIFGGGAIFFKRMKQMFQLADEAEGELTTVIQENLTGIRVVRAFARQEFERDKFARANAQFRDRTERWVKLMGSYWALSDFLCIGQLGAALLLGAQWLGQGRLTIGTLFAFLTYANMLVWPVRQLGRTLADLGKATVAMRRTREVLALEVESDAGVEVMDPSEFAPRGAIEVSGLSFAYLGGAEVLRDVSFEVAAGETLAILGPAGAGKTTLVHLLLRLYDYQRGSIRVDGRELKEVAREVARTRIAAVLQEPFLYSKTIGANVRLGGDSVAEPDLVSVTKTACIHDEVNAFDRGYETLVGERGVMLSGGQRQRLTLARALLKEPPVLVLDDSLSAVDSRTESRIREALTRRRGRRTTLIIAHRLSTLAASDRMLVLDGGRVVQLGTHDELVQQEGLYRRLWRIQTALEREIAQNADDHGERASQQDLPGRLAGAAGGTT